MNAEAEAYEALVSALPQQDRIESKLAETSGHVKEALSTLTRVEARLTGEVMPDSSPADMRVQAALVEAQAKENSSNGGCEEAVEGYGCSEGGSEGGIGFSGKGGEGGSEGCKGGKAEARVGGSGRCTWGVS